MEEHTNGDCYTRDCVLNQDIAYCGVCEQFPCDTIMTKPHTTVLDKDWLRWKKGVIPTDKEKPMKNCFAIDQVDENSHITVEDICRVQKK